MTNDELEQRLRAWYRGEVGEDGLEWTLRLREGLRFHDKEPVLARDVVASIRRFAPRVIFANALMETTDELSAPDDRTVRFRLKRPFPQLPMSLAGPGGTVPVIRVVNCRPSPTVSLR